MMKLNFKQPYGVITGHPSAVFEQEGLLFDGQGNQIGEPQSKAGRPAKKVELPTINENQISNAKAFLETLLQGGPIDKSVVFKEAENNNQRWDTVKIAFESMNGKISKLGKATLWALNTETI